MVPSIQAQICAMNVRRNSRSEDMEETTENHMIDINSLTIGQEKELAALFGGAAQPQQPSLNGTLTPLSIIIAAAEAKAREAEGK